MTELKLILGMIGLILIGVSIERWSVMRRRKIEEKRERANLRHEQRWWKDPPGDGPEGDY